MKNSEISTILISRNAEIQSTRDSAMVKLDEWNHVVGNLVMIKYYTDKQKTNIDTLFAVGVKEGRGRDCYSIISTAELYVVNDILYEDPVSVESLVDNQRFLCKQDEVWKILKLGPNKYRTYTDIPEDLHIFRNLADGFQYFYVDGELKREDSFITAEEVKKLMKELEEAIERPPKIAQLEIVGGTIYPAGSIVSGLQFNLSVINYKDEDITDQFDVRLYKNDGQDEVNIEKINNNSYRIYEDITVTTTYSLEVIGSNITLEDTFTISLVNYTLYGKMSEYDPAIVPGLTRVLWDGKGEFEFTTNLENEITILAIPMGLVNQEFTSIKDTHGLNYIDDYIKENYESYGSNYIIYHKKDQVTINNFKQTFGYE